MVGKHNGEAEYGYGVTRRCVLGSAMALGIGVGLDRLLSSGDNGANFGESVAAEDQRVPFYGPHQAGIGTPQPEHLEFAAVDVASDSVGDLHSLLQEWTVAAAALMNGDLYEPTAAERPSVPADSGEAIGAGPAQLTITIGFGPSLFETAGKERFGLASSWPKSHMALPPFKGDSLESDRSGGDICVQACAEDPQVAFHAIHVLIRIAEGVAALRWSQQGFGRTSSTSREQPTPRNLMGFKDGTNNVRAEDEREMDEHVWVQPGDGPAWMEGGTYMVVRRIQMLLDVWDATSLEGQERAVGREKVSGAPLGQESEFDPVDLDARAKGELAIPTDAHIRLASPDTNGGQRILRRGFSYTEPSRAGSGQLDAGLFFISFQRDPQRQFVPIQRRLAANDALSRHLLHASSGVFACPPGVQPGGFIGEGLFA
ncbi:MAG TPA: iron uptake transporter deferrochelatase/peroxidase subunit [Solirubrobacterales bacterium]|nr:iron uptake transporter deferrochelatase/peroxidase subunit [Solirubrobacterales bacterium]